MPRNLHENSKELEVLLAIQRQEEKEQGKASSLKAGVGEPDRQIMGYLRLTEVQGAEIIWKEDEKFLVT